VGCIQDPGPLRLACLRNVPTAVIRAYTNGPLSRGFGPVVDNVTLFDDNFQRIRAGNTARVPILAGNTQNDGTLFTVGDTNLTAFLSSSFGGVTSPAEVRALYPVENDTDVIADSFRDFFFLWYAYSFILLPVLI
jgi:carboxylesterase type B